MQKGYRLLVRAQIANWHVKSITVDGVTGNFQKEMLSLAQPFEKKAFSIKDAVVLQEQIVKAYPMLTQVRVKRGLLNGELKLSAKRRIPVAKFSLPDGSFKYIDTDSVVYADPNPDLLKPIPLVELEGTVPQRLSAELVDLVEQALKLDRELSFAILRINLTDNTVKMYMADKCRVDFGQATHLKKKADRAAQILALARNKYTVPFALDFRFFEEGKVFLTQLPH